MHNPAELAERLLTLAAELEEPMAQYLDLKAACDRCDRGKHSKLAECIQKIEEGSHAAKESEALASKEYREFLKDWADVEGLKVMAQVQYETLKCKYEAARSVLAYDRDSMRNLG